MFCLYSSSYLLKSFLPYEFCQRRGIGLQFFYKLSIFSSSTVLERTWYFVRFIHCSNMYIQVLNRIHFKEFKLEKIGSLMCRWMNKGDDKTFTENWDSKAICWYSLGLYRDLSWNFLRFHEILFQKDAESFSVLSWKKK